MPVTLAELARLAGVSHTTVSMALSGKHRGRVSEATRKRILALALKHDYRANLAARGLAQGRTYRIAVCIQGRLQNHAIIGGYSLYERLALFSRGIQDAGYAMELVEVDADTPPAQTGRDLARRSVDGFVFLAWSPQPVGKLLFSLREKEIPAVASGTTLDDDTATWTDVDRYDAFKKAAASLIAEGHREIVLLDIDPGRHSALKIEAFSQTMRDRLKKDPDTAVFRVERSDFENTLRITETALDARPKASALLLTDNFYAEAVFHVLRRKGREPGRDCRIISFGDTTLADRISPRLSHYSLQIAEQVEVGLASLLEEIQDPSSWTPRQVLLPAKYIPRDT